MVAHTYNPTYLGGRDEGDQGLRSAWAKSSQTPVIPATQGSINRRFLVQASLGINGETLFEKWLGAGGSCL
jgi:hypothetical protein